MHPESDSLFADIFRILKIVLSVDFTDSVQRALDNFTVNGALDDVDTILGFDIVVTEAVSGSKKLIRRSFRLFLFDRRVHMDYDPVKIFDFFR